MKDRYTVFGLVAILALAAGLMLLSPTPPAAAQMQPTSSSDRLAPWPTVFPPSQADLGAQEYYQRCMVCHGDRGQGLTTEWRGALDPADQNCWQSGCHAPKHPPGGFVFPKYVPPVVGLNGLVQYKTAQGVFDFIQKAMPFQAPGSLPEETYWQLTAYLLRSNGYIRDSMLLSSDNAASIELQEVIPASQTAGNFLTRYGLMLGLSAGILLVWFVLRLARLKK